MHSPRRLRVLACAVLLVAWLGVAGLVAPAATLADTDLVVGGEAVVAYAQGDNVRVRDAASDDAGIVATIPEGITVSVLDGPFNDGAGNIWYRVSADGADGYMVSDYLARADGADLSEATVTATDNVHLRSGPSVGYLSIGKIPAGTPVTVLDSMDGWLRVSWNGFQGWSYGEFFVDGGAPAPEPGPAPEDAGDDEPETGQTEPGTRYTVDSVNFRTEPSLESAVIELLPAGVAVELTGTTQGAFAEVTVNGATGWVSLDFLTTTAPAEPEPEFESIEAGTRYTTDRVNFRSSSSLDSDVLQVLTPGTAVELTGRAQDGYAEITVDGTTGWVSLEYLGAEPPVDPDENLSDEPEAEQPEEEPAAPADASSAIIWPVSGGEWYIGQGYNGSSHQNNGSLWQYRYSFDLARTDENTGGQPVYSPVSGTVRWLDPSTGGISIDAGGGLAVALFHVDIDPSVTEGDTLTQGEYIGAASYPGGGGNGGWSHVHMTAWATTDGGNWDRQAIPFEGIAAISGQEFPSSGVSQDWTGTVIYP